MVWTNFHNHCHYDDGKGTPEEHIKEAINQNVDILGFSCHAPLPFDALWTMNTDSLKEYLVVIRKLQKEYEKKIKILLGLEIDYIPNKISPSIAEYKHMNLDYSIGSVHHLDCDSKGQYMPVDASDEYFELGLKTIYNGNIKKAVETYYRSIQEMVDLDGFDILGHFDLIKKNNKNNKYFYEDEKWYKDIVLELLEQVKNSGHIIEVNTGGMTRNYIDTTYPSPWILSECLKIGIPITLTSDSHSPKTVISGFENAAKSLLDIGYKEIFVLRERSWVPRALTSKQL